MITHVAEFDGWFRFQKRAAAEKYRWCVVGEGEDGSDFVIQWTHRWDRATHTAQCHSRFNPIVVPVKVIHHQEAR